MNAERSGYREAKRKEPLGILPALAVRLHNQAVRSETLLGRLLKVGLIKAELIENMVDYLHWLMDDRDFNRVENILESPSKYNPVKHFDCITLKEDRALFSCPGALKKGESYLRINLDPFMESFTSNTPITLLRINKAMKRVAEYINLNRQKLPSKNYLVGITHRSELIKASKRFGFTVTETFLPESVMRHFVDPLEKRSGISLSFQTYDEIIKKFSGSNQPEKTA